MELIGELQVSGASGWTDQRTISKRSHFFTRSVRPPGKAYDAIRKKLVPEAEEMGADETDTGSIIEAVTYYD
jgi:hypothetical protein